MTPLKPAFCRALGVGVRHAVQPRYTTEQQGRFSARRSCTDTGSVLLTHVATNFEAFNGCTRRNYSCFPCAASNNIRKPLYQNRVARCLVTWITLGGIRADCLTQRSTDCVSQRVS